MQLPRATERAADGSGGRAVAAEADESSLQRGAQTKLVTTNIKNSFDAESGNGGGRPASGRATRTGDNDDAKDDTNAEADADNDAEGASNGSIGTSNNTVEQTHIEEEEGRRQDAPRWPAL